ncbi:MAG: PrpF domain-containing protein [Acetobacteraceae bacterium]|jgi:4-oxalomesaconate tautomerase
MQTASLDPSPRLRSGVIEFPVLHVRGGTSTGLVISEYWAPREQDLREELLRHLMGLPLAGTRTGNKQITGLGRIVPTGNKVFFARMEQTGAGQRIVSTFAQLAADKAAVDWSVNCGNMSAALPLWALDTGQVEPAGAGGTFEIDIFNTNTSVTAGSRLRLGPDGAFVAAEIPGVDGSFPGVDLFLANPVGAKTGRLLPTGQPVDEITGYKVSCVDVAVPMVIARASDFGKTAHENIEHLDADRTFIEALRAVWVEAGLRMALKGPGGRTMTTDELAQSETIPKICIVGPPQGAGHIAVRYFTPQTGHRSMAVSGGCCLAAAALIPGSVAHAVARSLPSPGASFNEFDVGIENPAGVLEATIEARLSPSGLEVRKAAYRRSTQILLRGHVPLYRASDALRGALLAVCQ